MKTLRARSETGPSNDERLFSSQTPMRGAALPWMKTLRARSETGPSNDERLFLSQEFRNQPRDGRDGGSHDNEARYIC